MALHSIHLNYNLNNNVCPPQNTYIQWYCTEDINLAKKIKQQAITYVYITDVFANCSHVFP